jgi:predicted phosphodiesterase
MTSEIENIKGDIISIYENGGRKADAARYIMEHVGLGTTQSKFWASRIHEECITFGSANEGEDIESVDIDDTDDILKSDLYFEKKYVYNKEEDNYIFLFEKKFGKNIIRDGSTIRSMLKNYSNYDGHPDSLNKIATRYALSREIILHIFRSLNFTHDSLPVTQEELEERNAEDIKEDILAGKRFALHQEIQKADWKATELGAKKWNNFVIGKYNPFLEALEDWNPPVITSDYTELTTPVAPVSEDNSKVFMCILTDTHIGELTKTSWEGKTFNTKKAVENIISYLEQINSKLGERSVVPSACKLVIMGDILNSFVDGMTRKGTKLHNDVVNADLYKVGLDVIITVVRSLRNMFSTVDISCVKGNHDSDLIYAVYYAASRYFEHYENVEWNISEYWLDSFKVNNCYFIYSHGKDDVNHVGLPATNGKKFESFVQSLLLAKVHELIGVKSKYFLSGHLHSYQHNELNDFEQIQIPASVTADDYAEALGFRSKARQNCFIVGENHIEETLHFFFD